jgi:DnaJ-class molecular chaperone
MENKTILVDIQSGVEDNHEILYAGEGDLVDNAIPGDVIVKVKI